MKIIKAAALILAMSVISMVLMGSENNPCIHTWSGTLYDCNVAATCTAPTDPAARTLDCSSSASEAISMVTGWASYTGSCKKYKQCSKCGTRESLGTNSVAETGTYNNPRLDTCGHLASGSHTVSVNEYCHADHLTGGTATVASHLHRLRISAMERTSCYMTGQPVATSNYVHSASSNVPLGSTWSFETSWTNPNPNGATVGKDTFKQYICNNCTCIWSFATGAEKVAGHHVEYPAPSIVGGVETLYCTYPHLITFTSTGNGSVTFTKDCKEYLTTFSGWLPADITIGACTDGTYQFDVKVTGVASLDTQSKVYKKDAKNWYILKHIDPDPQNHIDGRSSILTLDALPTGSAWPSVSPVDGSDMKYPRWGCSPPGGYTQPNYYEFDGHNGDASAIFKGKAYGTYTINANCGTEANPADAENNLGVRVRRVHVVDPKVTASFSPKVVSPCDGVVPLTLTFAPNNVDIGSLNVTFDFTPDYFYSLNSRIEVPPYEVFADAGCTIPFTQTSISVGSTDTTHQLYNLVNGSHSVTVYVLPHARGTIKAKLKYDIGDKSITDESEGRLDVVVYCASCRPPLCLFSLGSINCRLELGSSAFSKPGGNIQIKSETLDEDILSLSCFKITPGAATTVTYDTNYPGYPTLADTGLYRAVFTYERVTVNGKEFVKKITVNYDQGVSTTVFSTVVLEIKYHTEGEGESEIVAVDSFDAASTEHLASGDVTKNWSFKQQDVVAPPFGQTPVKAWRLTGNGTDVYLAKQDDGDVRTEYYYTGSVSSPVSTTTKVKNKFDWGYETVSETVRGETTAYEYYSAGAGGKQGLVKKVTHPRGNSEEYFYDTDGNVIRQLTQAGGLTKETLTTRSGNTTTVIEKYGDQTVSKHVNVAYYGSYAQPDQDIQYDESNQTFTTLTYRVNNPGNYFHGKPRLVKRPDGTVTVNEYSKTSTLETVISYTGVPNDPQSTSPTVTDGIKTETRSNSNGQTVYSASWDIASNIKLSEETATASDSFGRVTAVSYLDGSSSSKVYGCCGVEQETDRNGTVTNYAYDEATKRLSYSIRDGITTFYTYDADGNATAVTVQGRDEGEITTSSTYVNGQLTTQTDPLNNVTTYSNNGDTITYPDNSTQITAYYQGMKTGVSGTAVHAQTFSSGPDWQKVMPQDRTTYTDMLGRQYKVVYADSTYNMNYYNSKMQLSKQVSPAGRVTLYEYDSRGRQSKNAIDMNANDQIDGADLVTEYAYSFSSRDSKTVAVTTVTQKQNTDSKVVSVTETSLDGLHSWVTGAGGLTTYAKTERLGSGQARTTVTSPDGSKVVTDYTNGRVTSIEKYNTDETAGNVTEYTYDEFNRVSSVVEKLGQTEINTVSYTYDAAGQVLTETVNGRATGYVYDSRGRLTQTTLPGSREINQEYYLTGELKKVYGADTYTRLYTYNALGSMATLTTYKDANTPEVTSWSYNNLGLMTAKTDPGDKSVAYTYNADRQPATRTWSRLSGGNPLTTTYGYDAAGRPTGVDYSDSTPDVTMAYDFLNRKTSVTDGTGTRTFTYNTDTSLASITVPHIVNGVVEYGYDTTGRKTSMQLLEGNTVKVNAEYAYDVRRRIASVSDGVYTAAYTRNAGTGLVTGMEITDDNDNTMLTAANSYDQYYRLTGVTAGTRSYSYTYNTQDKRTRLTYADNSYWEYTYDSLGQVASAIKYDANGNPVSGHDFNYSYDQIGNRLTSQDGDSQTNRSYASNLINQYTAINSESPNYDDDGNMLTRAGWNQSWDAENRLIQTINSDGTVKLEFAYDYLSRRVEKKVYNWNSGTSVWDLNSHLKFVYDGYKQIAEYVVVDGTAALSRSYLWQPTGQDVPLLVNDAALAATYFYIVDGNKNVRAMFDTSGNAVAGYDYNAFGRITSSSGAYSNANSFRFSSEYFDSETGLVYYNFRYYDPYLGRWLSKDPIEEKGGWNLYGMVGNNPVNRWDIRGLVKWTNTTPATEEDLGRYSCILKELGIDKLYPEEYRMIEYLTPSHVTMGEPHSLIGNISGEAKDERMYIAYAGLEGILENIVHESSHIIHETGFWDDTIYKSAQRAGEKVLSLIAAQKKTIVANYYCCKKRLSGGNKLYPIPVSGWDYILNKCGIDTNNCSANKDTHMATGYPSLSPTTEKSIKCKCEGL